MRQNKLMEHDQVEESFNLKNDLGHGYFLLRVEADKTHTMNGSVD